MRLSGKGVARKIAKLYRVLANWFGKQIPKKMELGAISLLEGVRPPHGVGWKTRLTAGPHQVGERKGLGPVVIHRERRGKGEGAGLGQAAASWARRGEVGRGERVWGLRPK